MSGCPDYKSAIIEAQVPASASTPHLCTRCHFDNGGKVPLQKLQSCVAKALTLLRKEARVIHHHPLPVHTSTFNGSDRRKIAASKARSRERATARWAKVTLFLLPWTVTLFLLPWTWAAELANAPAAPFTAGRRPPATDGYAAACSRRALSIARYGRRIRPQSRLQGIQIPAPRRHCDRRARSPGRGDAAAIGFPSRFIGFGSAAASHFPGDEAR